jgi:hypothetical protein
MAVVPASVLHIDGYFFFLVGSEETLGSPVVSLLYISVQLLLDLTFRKKHHVNKHIYLNEAAEDGCSRTPKTV